MSSAQSVWELCRAVLNDRDGWVAVLKAYMDESGTHDGSPVVAVGLYVAKPKTWRSWTKEWNFAKRPVKVYHAVDCHNRHGEFHGWTSERRDDFVKRVLPVITRHEIAGIVVGIDMRAFAAAMLSEPDLKTMFGTPYTACFQWAVQTLIEMLNENGHHQRIAFFHESSPYRKEAEAAFAYIKAQKVLGDRTLSLSFGGKEDFVPLQAADILAYEGNRLLRNLDAPERPPWLVLNPEAGSFGQYRIRVRLYGEANMADLISRLSAYRQKLLAAGWDGKVD